MYVKITIFGTRFGTINVVHYIWSVALQINNPHT